jgi:hypothetical protein
MIYKWQDCFYPKTGRYSSLLPLKIKKNPAFDRIFALLNNF